MLAASHAVRYETDAPKTQYRLSPDYTTLKVVFQDFPRPLTSMIQNCLIEWILNKLDFHTHCLSKEWTHDTLSNNSNVKTICTALYITLLLKKVKEVYSSSWNLRATEDHKPYGITQCYLPPDTGERAPP